MPQPGQCLDLQRAGRWAKTAKPGTLNYARAVEQYLDTLSKAHKYDVTVVFGGDTYHANPTIEYKALIEAGFSPMEALNAGTINAAVFLGLNDQLGTIEKGKLADLVVLEGNPLENPDSLRDVIAVMKEAKVFTPEGFAGSG